ncbi:MAG: glycoside hydrolase family 127 protein [Bacteroidia bacterium]|nr:glycoside hydrolase family 127 protein [Bacteroidia bacterium]
MKKLCFWLGLLFLSACKPSPQPAAIAQDYPIHPVPFTDVLIDGGFWLPRLDTNRRVTIPYDFKKCEETGRIDNFAIAGGLKKGEFRGKRYDDSDVFKVIEGASYSLKTHADPTLETYLDSLIFKIAAAQEDDGYLYTTRTINPDKPVDATPGRWSNMYRDHELYNVGHLYEAAVAHYQATGKRTLLDVALKNADLLTQTFGPGLKSGVPDHQEIEIGLAKLYRTTGEKKYLDLARFFLNERGKEAKTDTTGRDFAYIQNHLPVAEQTEAVGHAVRAGYMYSGMADIGALTGDTTFIHAIDRLWENVVNKKMYLTGGIGSRSEGEAFGEDYELPNATAYNETCAAIANMFWNHRLFLLHGEAKYMDIFERVLYNGFLGGVSLDGNAFFYPNVLETSGDNLRQPWFNTACCPVNVVRFLPSLPGYAYAWREEKIYINLFLTSTATIRLPEQNVVIEQITNYPWEGKMNFTLTPEREDTFEVALRIPGWADNQPVPGILYQYTNRTNTNLLLRVNGELLYPEMKDGFAHINRKWKAGDRIELTLPMPVRRIAAHESVTENRGKVALERGPLVYCAESVDNNGKVLDLNLPEAGKFEVNFSPDLLGGLNLITGTALRAGNEVPFTAIPYYARAHRGSVEMRVWFPVYYSLR